MNTDQLIDRLSEGVRPVPRRAVGARIALGVAAGCMVSVLVILVQFGVRTDMDRAMGTFSFWMKWAYTLSIAIGAVVATVQLARPYSRAMGWLWVLAVPVVLLAATGVVELLRVPEGQWLSMWLGSSWRECPWRVLLLALPIFVGLLWAFRRLAPTRLRAAGAAAGLSAGGFAASVYCLHCAETSAIFVLTWYSLGIALAAGIGALTGPRLLRW